MNEKKISTALVSVYYKEGLERIIKRLNELGVKIISTGGTGSFISDTGVDVDLVEDLTDYPSILGGRVKTLHPKVFGGILARRDNKEDIAQLEEYLIPQIDLVIVDLYPFEETVASGAEENEIIEKIDIGGIALIRAAAKNFNDTIIVSGREQYDDFFDLLEQGKGYTSLSDRKRFAGEAFDISSNYDTAIYSYFNSGEESSSFKESIRLSRKLRYGENPHQQGTFFGNFEDILEQLHGKEISYNNLLDIDAAVNLIAEFDETTFAILKHNNACGAASRDKLIDAWRDALAGDPISAFGGVLISNKEIDPATAEEMDKLFFEVIIAPSYNSSALEILKRKKNRIILILKDIPEDDGSFRTCLNGVLWQDKDVKTESLDDMKAVTTRLALEHELDDLKFANILVKHSKSNCIVLAGRKQLLGSGVGMTSRIDALKHALEKAKTFGLELKGAVMASDAFFPFADSVEIAHKEGISAVIQPGGSVNDKLSIEYCDTNNLAMVFTGTRHFKH
jgi:phosphoribosylaminoimidazolecarboxamide formyltransferase/IMP cyclohydrolase